MIKPENELRSEIVEIGRLLHRLGFIAGYDGNITARLDGRRILSTPTAICKGMMGPDDLVIVDGEGCKISGGRDVTSEIAMHLLIYKQRPDVHGVVHAHPPTATGYAAAGMALDKALVSEVVLSLGSIPLARYATPGTSDLAETLRPLVGFHDAILMANHGAVAYGSDLMRAYFNMETVEHFAKISLVTQMLGRQVLLSQDQVGELIAARARYFGSDRPPAAEKQPPKRQEAKQPSGAEPLKVSSEELAAVVSEVVKSLKSRP